jgi:hypothetical protein
VGIPGTSVDAEGVVTYDIGPRTGDLSPGGSSLIGVPGSIVHADGRITYGGQAGTSIGFFPSGNPAGSSNPANRNLGTFPSGSSGTSSNPAIQKTTVGSAPSGGSVGSSNPAISNPGNPHVVATGASITIHVVSSEVPSISTPKLTNSDKFCLDVLDRSIAVQRLFNTNVEVLIDEVERTHSRVSSIMSEMQE